MIEARGVKKSYGKFEAVKGVDLSVRRGEIFGILGPNGAGKTSLLEMMEGLRPLSSGEVWVNGIPVTKQPEKVKAVIGVQLQSSSFFDRMSLVELLKVFGSLYNSKKDPDELLSRVGLLDKKKAEVKNLSGGQKQRFSIAAALVNDPVVLFLDEPTTGLDPQARRNLWTLVRSIRESGTTILLTTHYMEEAETLCDRVAVMDAGKIIALNTPENLVKALLARGFTKKKVEVSADLEDVFIDLTGHDLRESES
ncbi:MAG: ABC transporter ATP-binding protein [Spirochaetia bacterium]|nr:ABC transporter ATP-binding protein [Spirochaetia bacterium]